MNSNRSALTEVVKVISFKLYVSIEEDSSPRTMPDFWLYGDIKLTDHQKALLDVPVGADDFIHQRKPPAATREKTLLWEGGVIPYVFDCSMSKLAPQRIKMCPTNAFCVEKFRKKLLFQ